MNKYDNLIIRACKSNGDTVRRLKKIYGWAYAIDVEYVHFGDLAHYLFEIVEKYNPISSMDLARAINPSEVWKTGAPNGCGYWEGVVFVLASRLRLTEIGKLPEYRASARWRKRNENE
jgi:hypothetical protein